MEINEKLNGLVLDISDFSKKNKIIGDLCISEEYLGKITKLGLLNGKKEALYVLEKILSSKIEDAKENKVIFQCAAKIFLMAFIVLNKTKKESEIKYTEALNNFFDITLKNRNNLLFSEALKFAFNILIPKSNRNDYSMILIDINTKILEYNCNYDNNGDRLRMIKCLIGFSVDGCRNEIKEVFNNFISSETNSFVSEDFVKNLLNTGFFVSRGSVNQRLSQEYMYQILECFKTRPEYILPCFVASRNFLNKERGILNYIKSIYKELNELNLLDDIQNLVIQGIINNIDEKNLIILYAMYHLINENSRELGNSDSIESSVYNDSVQENINYSINKGTNIDAYDGLSSKFIYFIRCVVMGNDDDERCLNEINRQLVELEKLDKNNVVEVLKIYANIIHYVLSLSLEAKNDVTMAFEKQTTLEEKINETFPQIGTIILNSATINENGETLFCEEDVSILLKMSNNISSKGWKTENYSREDFLKLSFDAKKIILKLVENSPEFFENLNEGLRTGLSDLEESNVLFSEIKLSRKRLVRSSLL